MDLGNLLLLGFIAALVLGPRETRRMAHKLGKWMHDLRKMSGEFTSELKREADLVELTEGVQSIQNTINKVKDNIKDAALGDLNAPAPRPKRARESAAPSTASEAPAAEAKPIAAEAEPAGAELQKVSD